MNQISPNEIMLSDTPATQLGRTAYIDESGNFGFDFENSGTSLYYIVCAMIVKNEHIETLENAVEKIRHKYFGNGEMKSNTIGRNHSRRAIICTELLKLDFSVIVLIADKQSFYKDSPLTLFKESFVKFLHQKLYDAMYTAYPKLRIVEDEYGSSEFQKGYRKYVHSHRPKLSLFDQYDFDYINSKHGPLVQVADIVAGSIAQTLQGNHTPDYRKIFQGKIIDIVNFPSVFAPCFAEPNIDRSFDASIYELAHRCATRYIESNDKPDDEDIRLRVLFLKHLLFVVRNISADKFVSSAEITKVLTELSHKRVKRDYLYRKIIAPLRDDGVIIASSAQGYKIPTCVDNVYSYANQTNGVIGPMLSRVGKCRDLILKQTDGTLDIFDDPALKKYKRYFGDY